MLAPAVDGELDRAAAERLGQVAHEHCLGGDVVDLADDVAGLKSGALGDGAGLQTRNGERLPYGRPSPSPLGEVDTSNVSGRREKAA